MALGTGVAAQGQTVEQAEILRLVGDVMVWMRRRILR
jgi:hypothetical protein